MPKQATESRPRTQGRGHDVVSRGMIVLGDMSTRSSIMQLGTIRFSGAMEDRVNWT